ncbi:hypothetical protein VTL71DRAFT_12496 [Oculimacula yallundae]|uniref:Uncharacterized protein n=1 Tax=Oculimacula yallundae TaxID=86028 RepID=A0ABR4CMP7_9HELO
MHAYIHWRGSALHIHFNRLICLLAYLLLFSLCFSALLCLAFTAATFTTLLLCLALAWQCIAILFFLRRKKRREHVRMLAFKQASLRKGNGMASRTCNLRCPRSSRPRTTTNKINLCMIESFFFFHVPACLPDGWMVDGEWGFLRVERESMIGVASAHFDTLNTCLHARSLVFSSGWLMDGMDS